MSFPKMNVPSPYSPQYDKIREYDKDMAKMLEQLLSNLTSIFDQGIKVEDSLDAQVITFVSSATPDAENTIAHALKRVPIGFNVISQDKAASFYKGSTAFTATNFYVKSSVASVAATLLVF
jgi:hypothetical protein